MSTKNDTTLGSGDYVFFHAKLSWSFQVAKTINAALSERPLETKLGLIIFVESAIGLLNLKDVCQKGTELSLRSGMFQLEGVVFGSDDFCADIGKVSF